MAQYLDTELQHSNYFLIMHGKEYHSLSMIYDLTISTMTTWSPDWGQSDFQYWVDITQNFGMESLSNSNPNSSRIFKHRLPTYQYSHCYPNDHHCTAHISQHSISPFSHIFTLQAYFHMCQSGAYSVPANLGRDISLSRK